MPADIIEGVQSWLRGEVGKIIDAIEGGDIG
jgi:hypothetical protein